jgi:hypothetical protein
MTGTSCICKDCGCPRLAEDASGICWLCRHEAHYRPLPRVAAAEIDHSGTRIAHRLGRPPEEYGYCRRACETCIHAAICKRRDAIGDLTEASLDTRQELPAGVSVSIAATVDCDAYAPTKAIHKPAPRVWTDEQRAAQSERMRLHNPLHRDQESEPESAIAAGE